MLTLCTGACLLVVCSHSVTSGGGGLQYHCVALSLSSDPGDPRSRHQQRVPDRTSPVRHYSPLPRINPSSPSSQSREGSFTALLANSYGHPRQQRPYPDSFRQQPGYPDSHRQQTVPDPQDSPDANHRGHPSRSKPLKERDGEGGGGEEEGEEEDEEEGYPSPSHRSYKETPQTSPRREAEDGERGAQSRHHPAPDNYQDRAEDSRNPDRVPPPLDRESPRHSPETSPVRKGAAAQAYRGANGYERDAAYTNNTNEDSGFAGLTPEDQYKNRDKEIFYDSLNR